MIWFGVVALLVLFRVAPSLSAFVLLTSFCLLLLSLLCAVRLLLPRNFTAPVLTHSRRH